MNHAVRNCSSFEWRRLKFVRRGFARHGLLLALVWATAVVPLAARAADEPPAKPTQPTPATASATWEKLIYVPYRALKSVLQDPKAAAIVPLDEYLRWLQSNRGPATRLPIAAVLTEAHYNAKVDKDVVRIHGVLTIQSLEKHWSGATVAFGEAAIGKITSEKDRVLVRGLGAASTRCSCRTKAPIASSWS